MFSLLDELTPHSDRAISSVYCTGHVVLVTTGDGNIGTQADEIAGSSRRFQSGYEFIPAPCCKQVIVCVTLAEEISTTLLVSPEIMKRSEGHKDGSVVGKHTIVSQWRGARALII